MSDEVMSGVPASGHVDRLGRALTDLRLSVTDRCNFRCRYCMPRELFGADHTFLERDELLTFEEMTRLLEVFKSLGVRKVRLTGGEPLLRRGLPALVGMLPKFDDLAMTTNGVLLPRLATPLAEAGLHRVTVSLDALDDETFQKLADTPMRVADVVAGIDAAREAGLAVKVNTVLQRGVNDDQLEQMAEWARERGLTLRFIEYMDVGTTNGWRREKVVPAVEIRDRLAARWSLAPVQPEVYGEVASRYRYIDGVAEVGIISSVTRPFCRTCTRARISSIGELYTCLFAASGTDLRQLVRGGGDNQRLAEAIKQVWGLRTDRASELRSEGGLLGPRVEMSYIGG
ncbi:GTP 3',8-cyclase MoaA [Nocardioides taihuensis]|uniref:GTP 3',8-cyclase n=1 Tax=Nocardioides taihuensis TaxID=1835606 RepID=A0ABW0BGP0_9ACTN